MRAMAARNGLSKWLIVGGRLTATVLIAAFVYRRINWGGLEGALRSARPVPIACAALLQGGSLALVVTRWRLLLAAQGIGLSWPAAARLSLVGLFFNLVLPGSVGGDAARFLGTVEHAPGRKHRLALSLLQDRIMGLGALLLLLSVFLVTVRPDLVGDRALRSVEVGVPCACAAFFAFAGAFRLLGGSLEAAAGDSPEGWAGLGLRALSEVFPRRVFLKSLALSLANHAVFVATGWLVANALGIPITYGVAAIVFCVTALALSLPITIAGLGVRDGMIIWMLSDFGFRDTGAAAGVSACMLGVALVWSLAGGLAFYWPVRRE
jgi:hypothetical protein